MKKNQELIDKIRRFNRFYTNVIGLLDQHYLNSPFSLTEGRVLYEICNTPECTAKKIRENITIDEGYLSRIVDGFLRRGYIKKSQSSNDKRLRMIVPTEKGKNEFVKLNENSNQLISQTILKLSDNEQKEFMSKLGDIQKLLEKTK